MLTYQQKKLSIACIIALAILGLVYGSVYIISRFYLTNNNIQSLIISQAEQTLNRKVNISNNIGFSIGWDMSPHIVLRDIAIANTSWSSHPIMLNVARIDIHFSLTQLLFKKFHIISLELDQPELYLETYNNQNNWDFQYKNSNSNNISANTNNLKLVVNKIIVTRGILHHAADRFTIDKLDVTIPNSGAFYHIHMLGTRNDAPIKATINIETTNEAIKLDIDRAKLGSSNISGNIDINKFPLKVTGKLTASTLAINDFSSNQDNPSGAYTIPNTTLNMTYLKDSVFDIKILISNLLLKNITLKNVTIQAQNLKNVFTVKFNPAANLANGKLDLSLALDLNYNIPRINLLAKTQAVQLESLMKQMFNNSPVTGGPLELNINLNSNGDNLNSIVNNLNGKILITVGPGAYLNSNASLGNIFTTILSSIITFDKTKASTPFTCGIMNFKVNNGVATANNGIGIEATSVNVLGNGTVDLRNGRIKFTITPQNLLTTNPIDLANFSIAQLVEINGTLNKPQVSMNPSGLLTASNGAIIAKVATGISGGLPGFAAIIAEQALGGSKPTQQLSPCQAAMAAQ